MDEELKSAINELIEVLRITNGSTTGLNAVPKNYKVLADESAGLNDIVRKENEEEKKAADLTEKIKADNEQAEYKAVSSLKGLSTAFLSGEAGFTKYASSMNMAGDAVWDASKNYGRLGIAIGGIAKGATFVAAASLEQADNLLKASDAISKMGAVNRFSTAQLYDFAHEASLTSKEMDKLIKPMQSMQGGLTRIGNSAADGVSKFAQMTNVTDKVRNEFLRMGMDNGARIQAQADYVTQMERTGVILRSTAKKENGLRDASLNYIRNMSILNEISGMDKKTLEDKITEAKNNMQYQIQERQWEKQLTSDISEEEKDKIKLEKEQTILILEDIARSMGPKAAAEFMKQKMTGETSVKFAQLGINANKYLQMIKKGTYERGNLNDEFQSRTDDLIEHAGPAIVLSKAYGNQMIEGSKGLQELNKFIGENQTALAKKTKTTQDGNTNNTTGPVVTDKAQILRQELTRAEEAARLIVDDLVKSMNPFVGDLNPFKTLISS
jgi:hypothetical protein